MKSCKIEVFLPDFALNSPLKAFSKYAIRGSSGLEGFSRIVGARALGTIEVGSEASWLSREVTLFGFSFSFDVLGTGEMDLEFLDFIFIGRGGEGLVKVCVIFRDFICN